MSRYEVGETIDGQFELLELRGTGGFGKVFRAHNHADGREYALKFFSSMNASLDSVRREFAPLRAIEHPNVVKAHWAAQTADGTWYLAMDFIDGESLQDRLLRTLCLPVMTVRRIGDQLLNALREMHPDEQRLEELRDRGSLSPEEYAEIDEIKATGLVHRDIKPANLILNEEGTLVLVDFGISSRAGSARETTAGTREYMPPDQVDVPAGTHDADLDRYAAGLVLAECACGLRDTNEPMDACLDRAEIAGEIEPDLATFLRRACARSRNDRFTSTAEMFDAWVARSWPVDCTPEPTDHDAPPPGVFRVRHFEGWHVRTVGAADGMSERDLIDLLVEIVDAEGPILCRRLYDLVADATGSRPTNVLNRFTYHAVRSGRLSQIEPLGGGQQDKTVYAPDTDPRVVRSLGPRSPWEVPNVELGTWHDSLLDAGYDSDEVVDAMTLYMSYGSGPTNVDELRYRIERYLLT